MRKTIELKKIINGLKTEVNDLQSQGMMDDAAKKAQELTDAVNEFKSAQAIEMAEDATFADFAKPATEDRHDAAFKNRAFNKALLGRRLDEEERDYVNSSVGMVGGTPGKGGYIVPEEQMHTLVEFRRDLPSFKNLVSVIGVNSATGRMPTLGAENGKLTAFDELTEIKQSDFDFSQVTYKLVDYGDIIPVSNTLLADNDFNLMDIIGRRFARKAVNTENDVVASLLSGVSSATMTDWTGLTKALNKTLDPAIAANASIVTNQSGLEWLDECVDKNGRPLLSMDLVDANVRRFKGKPVIVFPDSILSESNKIPFYVGSFADAIAFFDRQQVSVAVSEEAGFTRNATYIRAIERFDAKLVDAEALTKVTISTTAAASGTGA